MKYIDFEEIISTERMSRYLTACNANTRKSMTLYRKNLQLSQEMFTIISCFEVALRNAIDKKCTALLGVDWLRDGASNGGIFDNLQCRVTKQNINEAIVKLPQYNHHKLVAELGFGFWRFMFASNQFNATNRILLRVFPSKPTSTPTMQYNHTYIFNQLAQINNIRNRIAHHEPICFISQRPIKDSSYTRKHYQLILQLFQWMNVDEAALLYGIDHVEQLCNEIDLL
jgi:Abi-like protein